MKFMKFEKKIALIIVISMIVVFSGFFVMSFLNKKIIAYNHLVSITIDTQNTISDIQKNYFAYFAQKDMSDDYRNAIKEEVAHLEANRDAFISGQFPAVQSLYSDYDLIYVKIKSALRFPKTYQLSSVEGMTGSFENLLNQNQIVKQAIVSEIRQINTNLKYIGYIIILGIIGGISGILWTIQKDVLKPIREFKDDLKKRTETNILSNSDMEMKGFNALTELAEYYNGYTQKISVISDLNNKIYAQTGFDEVLQYVFNACKPFIPYNRIGIAIISEDGKKIMALRARADHPILLGRNYQEKLEHSTLADVIRTNEYRILNDLQQYLKDKPHSESTRLIVAEGLQSSITIPLAVEKKVVGVIFFSSKEKNAYNISHIHFLSNIANALAISFEKSFVYDELILASVKGFAGIVESKDHVTGDHIDRMSQYSKFIAGILFDDKHFIQTLDENFIEQVYKFSALHDIGKVGIGDSILGKPGKLTESEFDVMKTHTTIGYNILRDMSSSTLFNRSDFFKIAMEITKSHHEKFDGSGYPEGLSGHNIPISARIVALADVFDALTSERPYKKAFSYYEAMEIIKEGRGRHFDPEMVDCLLKHELEFSSLYQKMRFQ